MSFGDLQAGLWVDRQNNLRELTEVDFTLGGALNPQGNPQSLIPGVDRQLTQTLTTLQPFVEFDWKVTPDLTLSPGVRYDHFERSVDSQVNVKSGGAQSYSNDFSATLPSFLAHYQIASDWAAYAQAAKGFLAPNENFFNYSDPRSTDISPQQSWNYQVGSSCQTKALSRVGRCLLHRFQESDRLRVHRRRHGVLQPGRRDLQGRRGRGDRVPRHGLQPVCQRLDQQRQGQRRAACGYQDAPKGNATAGAIYNLQGWYASLLDKWVGKSFGDSARHSRSMLSARSTARWATRSRRTRAG